MKLVGRNGPKAAKGANLRKERANPRDGFFPFDYDREKSSHEKEPTSPSVLFTF